MRGKREREGEVTLLSVLLKLKWFLGSTGRDIVLPLELFLIVNIVEVIPRKC